MNWLEEVREVLRGMNVDSVEMSEMVVVKFGPVWLKLGFMRIMGVECQEPGLFPRATRSTIELIEDRLTARGWDSL